MTTQNSNLISFARKGIWINITGIITSGLLFPMLSMLLTPQPAWKDAATFAAAYHPLQTATFFAGFLLIGGSLMTFAALFRMAPDDKKLQATTAILVNCVFTAIVFINYIIQTTYIPYLATHQPAELQLVLPVFTMANPGSFAWALEMYGWGGIGVSFLFMAHIFRNRKGPERTLKVLFVLNGTTSCVSALVTSWDMHWLFSSAGLASLIIWNLLVLIIDMVLLKYFKKQQ